MITFTRYFLKRAKECKLIPFAEFTAIAKGKEGTLFNFFLTIKDTKLVEYSENGLKVIATEEQLRSFKMDIYKTNPPLKNYQKVSLFDINRKAKKFTPLALKILDYVKNNMGCDLQDLQRVFTSADFRDAHSMLINEGIVVSLDGEFFVAYADKDYQLLLNNVKSLGITLDEGVNKVGDMPGGMPCTIKIGSHTFTATYSADDTPEKIIYNYYMRCDVPQTKIFLRGKKAYLLNYANLIDYNNSYFTVTSHRIVFNLKFGIKLNQQMKEPFLNGAIDVEADFVIKSFGN